MTCLYIGNMNLNAVSPHNRGAEDTKRMAQWTDELSGAHDQGDLSWC